MKKQFYWLSVLLASLCLGACGGSEETAVIKVNAETLMHEVRATSVPFDGATVKINPPRFMWPDKFPHLGPVLDGVPGTVDEKHTALYRIRISQDKEFKKTLLPASSRGLSSILLSGWLMERGTGNTLMYRPKELKNGRRCVSLR